MKCLRILVIACFVGINTVAYSQWETLVSQSDSLLPVYNRALERAKKNNEPDKISYCYEKISDAYHIKHNKDSSLGVIRESINYFNSNYNLEDKRNHKIKSIQAGNYNLLGIRYQVYGQWDLALENYHKGLPMAEEAGNDSIASYLLLNIGKIYVKISDTELWNKYSAQAREKALNSNNYPVLLNLHKINGRNEEGLVLAKKAGNDQFKAVFYSRLSKRENIILSRAYMDSALITVPEDAWLERFQTYITFTENYLRSKDYKSARYYLTLSEKIVPILFDMEVDQHLAQTYWKYYFAQKDFKNALRMFQTRDSIQQFMAGRQKALYLKEYENLLEEQERILEIKILRNRNRRNFIIISLLVVLSGITIFGYMKIKQINTRLKDANRFRDRLFSIISHDLRSPLISLMKMFKFHPGVNGDKQKLNRGIQHILELLDNLLNWSASQTKHLKPIPIQLDLNHIVEQNISLIQNQAKLKNLNIHYDTCADYTAYADQNMIDTSFRNILINAVKYTPQGRNIWINIKEKDNKVTISVEDDGQGIGKNLNPKEKGIGLGLKICRDFINQNNGELKIQSDSLKGTTVEIILPVNS
ncbi:MAG: HAMP domain-containing histidine kinase [Bacteroidales bacterium]|nr:HAMP domain-containing histidine kinase [Bacteroidales bacterium]